MRKIEINEEIIDLTSGTNGYGILPCVVPPCEDHQCSAESTCRADATSEIGYSCICPVGYTGKNYVSKNSPSHLGLTWYVLNKIH